MVLEGTRRPRNTPLSFQGRVQHQRAAGVRGAARVRGSQPRAGLAVSAPPCAARRGPRVPVSPRPRVPASPRPCRPLPRGSLQGRVSARSPGRGTGNACRAGVDFVLSEMGRSCVGGRPTPRPVRPRTLSSWMPAVCQGGRGVPAVRGRPSPSLVPGKPDLTDDIEVDSPRCPELPGSLGCTGCALGSSPPWPCSRSFPVAVTGLRTEEWPRCLSLARSAQQPAWAEGGTASRSPPAGVSGFENCLVACSPRLRARPQPGLHAFLWLSASGPKP